MKQVLPRLTALERRLQPTTALAPLLMLAGAAAVELWAPVWCTGTPLALMAALTAAAVSSLRTTLAIAVAWLAVSVAVVTVRHDTVEYELMRVTTAVTGVVLAFLVARVLQSEREHVDSARSVVGRLQQAILPELPRSVGGFTLASRYEPADTEAAVGGDFYALVHTRHGLRVMIGDVRGKGVSAVRAVAVVVGAFHERADSAPDLAQLAADLDRSVARAALSGAWAEDSVTEGFATALLLQFDADGKVTVLNCGHPAPYAVADGLVREVPLPDAELPLGMFHLSSERGRPHTIDSAPPVLLCVTDGITETRAPEGTFFDPARHWMPPPHANAAQAVDHLTAAARAWGGRPRNDDVAVVAVEASAA
ncbi:PP2C family protein-serine/threonine phosphatase [Streptomyces sp. NPDC001661]